MYPKKVLEINLYFHLILIYNQYAKKANEIDVCQKNTVINLNEYKRKSCILIFEAVYTRIVNYLLK